MALNAGFNPLNQVYVFNEVVAEGGVVSSDDGFNPLNQVYVFNLENLIAEFEREAERF